jgi:hypothetical protein
MDLCHASTAACVNPYVLRKYKKRTGRQIGRKKEASCAIHQFTYIIYSFARHNLLSVGFPCRNVNRMSWEAVADILCAPKGQSDRFRMLVWFWKTNNMYLFGCYTWTKRTCHRTRRKASNISMIQTFWNLKRREALEHDDRATALEA